MKTKKYPLVFVTLLAGLLLGGCEAIPMTGHYTVVANAKMWEGSYYKRGQGKRCADWVGHVMQKSGYTPPREYALCVNWLKWGSHVHLGTIRPGDVVVYDRGSNGYNHIAIYVGGGKVIHRSTWSSPVKTMGLRYRRILGVRRPPSRVPNQINIGSIKR